MNWEAVGAIGEITSALVVVVTLIYVVLQVRYVRQQMVLTSMQHVYDSMNAMVDLIVSSESVTSIVRRGRTSYASLSEDEKLRFLYVNGRILNTIESWHMHVTTAMKPGPYREGQLRNIRDNTRLYFAYPGVAELWPSLRVNFDADVQKMMDEVIRDVSGSDSQRSTASGTDSVR